MAKPATVRFWGNADDGRVGVRKSEAEADPDAGGLGYRLSVPTPVCFGVQGDRGSSDGNGGGSDSAHSPLVKQVSLGGAHSLVLLDDGTLYAFGLGNEGQLGIERPSAPAQTRRHHNNNDDDNDSGGGGATAFFERLRSRLPKSIFSTAFAQWAPARVTGIPGRVAHISAGTAHSVAVTERGEVYTWGRGELGQLGVLVGGERDGIRFKLSMAARDTTSVAEPPRYIAAPRRVDALVDAGVEAASASAGGDFTVVLARDGTVYSFGNGVEGQLGVGDREMGAYSTAFRKLGAVSALPRKVRSLRGEPIAAVYAGASTVMALTERGPRRPIVWGSGRHGLLGTGVSDLNAHEPLPLDTLNASVRSVAFGETHVLALTADNGGGVFAWGGNEQGCLGLGYGDVGHYAVTTPQRVEALERGGDNGGVRVLDVAAGFKVSYALTRDIGSGGGGGRHGDDDAHRQRRTLYSWGSGQSGALARGGDSERASIDVWAPSPAVDLSGTGVRHVTSGFQHAAVY